MHRFRLIAKLSWGVLMGLSCTVTVSSGALGQDKLEFKAWYQLREGGRSGWLVLETQIAEGSYVYSLTQEGNPPPSRIQVAKSDQFRLSGKFKPSQMPIVIEYDPIFGNRLEKHTGLVRFVAPLAIAHGVDAENLPIALKFHGQLCSDDGCLPVLDKPVPVRFAGYYTDQ